MSEVFVLDGVEIRYPDGFGIRQIMAPGSNNCNDGMIGKIFIQNAGESGIHIHRSAGWTIDGCHTYSCEKSSIIIEQPWDTHVINTKCDSYGSSATAGTYYGIDVRFITQGRGVFVTNNFIGSNDVGTQPRVGIRMYLQTSCVDTVSVLRHNKIDATVGTIATGISFTRQGAATGYFVKDGNAVTAIGGTVTTDFSMTDGWLPYPPTALKKEIRIVSPTASDNIGIFQTDVATRIFKIHAVIVGAGSPSVDFNLSHGSDRSAAGTNIFATDQTINSVTTGADYTAFNDNTLTAGSHLWLTTSATNGTVSELVVTIYYANDY